MSFDFKRVEFGSKVFAASSTKVTFPESTSRSQSKTITITNLNTVTSVSVNTGTVTYSVSGDNITLNVSNGTATRSSTPSNTVTDSRTSSTNSFLATISYNSGGYSGTLSKSGSSFVISGSPAASKTVTVYSPTNTVTSTGWTNPWTTTSSSNSYTPPTTWAYSDSDGYTGNLPRTGTQELTSNPDHGVYHYGTPVNGRTPWTCHRYYKAIYSGTVTKPDTRVYQQNYSGTVYGATVYYYAYTVTVNHTRDQLPGPVITSPSSGATLSSTSVTVTWNSVTNATSYIFALRDLTTDTKIIDNISVSGTSYALTSLTTGHDYRVAVASHAEYYEDGWTESTFSISAINPTPTPTPTSTPTPTPLPTPTPITYDTIPIVFSNISSNSSFTEDTPRLSNSIERTGIIINGVTMVKITDLKECLGATISINGNEWCLERNGQILTFVNNSTRYDSDYDYGITYPETSSTVNNIVNWYGYADIPAQIINNEKYVQLFDAANQLGALMVVYNSEIDKYVVFDWRVSGTANAALSDSNTYIVGGAWLYNWSGRGSNNISQHFYTNELWDHSTPSENPQYYNQLKISQKEVQCLENVRYYYNRDADNNVLSMSLSCAFRSWKQNCILKQQGYSPSITSLHMRGRAWDAPRDELYIPLFDEFRNSNSTDAWPIDLSTLMWGSKVYPNGNSGGNRIEKMELDKTFPIMYELDSDVWLHLDTP